MTHTYPQGVPSWIDLEPADQAAAREFYGGLFDWEFVEVGNRDASYVIVQRDGQDVGGFGAAGELPPTGPDGAPGWNTYIAVDDADRTAAAVTAAGGRVLVPPTTVGPAGRLAVCEDRDGARFRLWQADRRQGAQLVNAPGGWNFSNLHAPDTDAAIAFYTDVFGWLPDEVAMGFIRLPGYADHLAATIDPDIHRRHELGGSPPGFVDAVAGLVTEPSPADRGWRVLFAVADRDETATSAASLGGTVLATEDLEWQRTALIRDPEGAVFAVGQFTPPNSAWE